MRASYYDLELKGQMDRLSMDPVKADYLKEKEDWAAVLDSMVLCRFSRAVFPWENLVKAIDLVTGLGLTREEVVSAGERITNLARVFGVGAGIKREDDYPAKRMMSESLPEGPSKGQVIEREDYDRMLDRYYRLRGWDSSGVPTAAKLKELDIEG